MSVSSFSDKSLLIDVEELLNCLDSLTLLDLRPTDDYALGHIPGARHIDIYGISLIDTSEAPFRGLSFYF